MLLWRGWLRSFAWTLGGVLAIVMGALVVSDPYDTARPFDLGLRGTAATSPRLAHASRARDPRFTGAILGNSHVQLLSPARLASATGIPFVSLTVPGSGAKETRAMLDWYMAHRPTPPAALVFGIDEFQCGEGREPLQTNPFPFWLYRTSTAGYLRGLFSLDSLRAMGGRVLYAALGWLPPVTDGYWDYEEGRTWTRPSLPAGGPPAGAPALPAEGLTLPGLDYLESDIARLPPDTAVILVRPPAHASQFAPPGSAQQAREVACLQRLDALAAQRPRTALLDFRRADPAWTDAEHFWDSTHYRRPLAERMEAEIAAALAALRKG
ncbi:MAG: hypothetical protein U1E62_13310 [Alsobacter sp.]